MNQLYQHIYTIGQNALRFRKLFLLALLLATPAAISAQPKTVYIDDNRISIEQAFNKIEKQTKYLFGFDRSVIDVSRRVELPRTQTSLNEMLDIILKDTECGYLFDGKSILIVKKHDVQPTEDTASKHLLPIITQTIQGVVVDDETGRPLMGAKVSVSGVIGKEVETDHTGQFRIENIAVGNQHIHTSHNGYYLSKRGVELDAAIPAELQVRMKSKTTSTGSIRSEADKGDIVTAETGAVLSPRDTLIQMPVVTTYESKIISRYPEGISYQNTKLGIKTNLLYLATMSPNIGIEWRMAPKWTMEVTAGFNMFEFGDNVSLNHWLVKPEVRYWLCRSFDGHFFGAHGIAGQFRLSELPLDVIKKFPKDRAYQGWAYGGGVTYGYQWAIGKRLNLEAAIGVGYLRFEYDDYALQDDCKTCGGRKTHNYFGPTKAGISLIYIIK